MERHLAKLSIWQKNTVGYELRDTWCQYFRLGAVLSARLNTKCGFISFSRTLSFLTNTWTPSSKKECVPTRSSLVRWAGSCFMRSRSGCPPWESSIMVYSPTDAFSLRKTSAHFHRPCSIICTSSSYIHENECMWGDRDRFTACQLNIQWGWSRHWINLERQRWLLGHIVQGAGSIRDCRTSLTPVFIVTWRGELSFWDGSLCATADL